MVKAMTAALYFLAMREDAFGFCRAGFEIDRVNQAAAWGRLQRDFEHIGFGRVKYQRRAHRRGERFDGSAHEKGLVGSFGQRYAQVETVRAALYLLARDLMNAFKILGEDQFFEFLAALGIQPLANQKGRRLLLHIGRLGCGCKPGDIVCAS